MTDQLASNTATPNGRSDLSAFAEAGWADLGPILDPRACGELRQWIDARRPVSRELFYQTEAEFRAKGRWHHYAPGRGDHNLLLNDDLDLRFVEDNQAFKLGATTLVGDGYRIMKKSIIRSVPQRVVPGWIIDYIREVGRPNLNPFVHDEAQDVQYFLSTDFHQDKTRPRSNFVTVYVYLDRVGAEHSALRILSGSHKLGMTPYPHLLRRSHIDRRYWFYSDFNGNHEKCEEAVILGEPGSVYSFHCMTLHGTGLNDSPEPRISLRYLLVEAPDSDQPTLLDDANRRVYGSHRLAHARLDVAPDGSFQKTGSSLLSYD